VVVGSCWRALGCGRTRSGISRRAKPANPLTTDRKFRTGTMRSSKYALTAAAVLWAPVAWSQAPTSPPPAAATDPGREGINDFYAGRYDEALQKLTRAYLDHRTPVLGLWSARAMVKLGKLVEAAMRYHEVTGLTAPAGDSAQSEAQVTALKERQALLPKIPKLTVIVRGADTNAVTVKVDAANFHATRIGKPQEVNPGQHEVVGTLGTQTVTELVILHEGNAKTIALVFEPPAVQLTPQPPPAAPTAAPAPQPPPTPPAAAATSAPPAMPPAPPPETAQPAALPAAPTPAPTAAEAAPAANPPPDTTTGSGGAQRTLGWVGIGVGGAGILLGGVTGVMMISKQGELDDDGCVNGHCYADQADAVDSYNSLRTLSTIGFAAGVLAGGTGLVLLLTAPNQAASAPTVQAGVGVGSAWVGGSF
jgi:hypothetical protein